MNAFLRNANFLITFYLFQKATCLLCKNSFLWGKHFFAVVDAPFLKCINNRGEAVCIRFKFVGNPDGIFFYNNSRKQLMLFQIFKLFCEYLWRNTRNAFLNIRKTVIADTYGNDDRDFPFPVDNVEGIPYGQQGFHTVAMHFFLSHLCKFRRYILR